MQHIRVKHKNSIKAYNWCFLVRFNARLVHCKGVNFWRDLPLNHQTLFSDGTQVLSIVQNTLTHVHFWTQLSLFFSVGKKIHNAH